MSRPSPLSRTVVCLLLVVATGCMPQQPFYLFEDGDLSHYKGMATDLEVPAVDLSSLGEVEGAQRPLSLGNPDPKQIWRLSLEEAVGNALKNSKVMRSLGASLAAPDSLTRSPESVPSIYDPARVESNPRFGVEAALAAFDTQFGTSVFWEKVDQPNNVGGYGTLFSESVTQEDNGTFQTQLSKYNATGGRTSITHNVAYKWSNSPTRAMPSDWNVDVTAEIRQPFLQGYGVQYNRIAGINAIPGYNNGVIVARIETDVALTDFEASVRNLVSDTERAYWELYLAYRELDAVKIGRDSALETWRKIKSLADQGAKGGEKYQLAQATEQYFLFKAQVAQRLSNLYAAERQLRYMMGLAPTDGRLIRPGDEPTSAQVRFEWSESQAEALVRNVDLRRQRWAIKNAEMELVASKNYLLPRLDFVARYQWLGLGDDLWDTTRKGLTSTGDYDNAYQSLTSGNFQQNEVGMEFSMPLGFRKEMAGVRYAQLNLTRERALLKEQELEVTHQLSSAISDVERGTKLMHDNYNRWIAAKDEVAAVQTAYDTGTTTLDVVLGAQQRLAEAEIEYYRTVVQYNLSIVEIHFRKGSLLEYNGVYLAEGPWPGKAYFDALCRARARDAGVFLDYGFTQPKVLSRGPVQQQTGSEGDLLVPEGDEETAPVELIPTPAPESPAAEAEEAKPAGSAAATLTTNGRLAARLQRTASRGGETAWVGSGQKEKASRGVELANYEPAATSSGGRSNLGSNPSSTPDESDANSTPAQAAGSASGWKSKQR